MNILLLSPYHSGSHRAWVDGWLTHTAHEVRVLSLPGRFWKWRMQGAAVTLAQQLPQRVGGGVGTLAQHHGRSRMSSWSMTCSICRRSWR